VWARDELAKVLRTQGARPLSEPSVTIPGGADAFEEDGELSSRDQDDRLAGLVEALASTTRMILAARSQQSIAG
jgi:hypothetical protein